MRLPSCKASGIALVALVGLTFGLANTDRAQANPYDQPDPYTRAPMRACLNDEVVLRDLAPSVLPGVYPCVWQANVMGNGLGHSFRIYRDGSVKRITNERAYGLLHGIPNHD